MKPWIENPCRLCLHGSSMNKIPDDPLYLDAIFEGSGVKISLNDELPQQLCNSCISFINQSRIFRKKSQETQTSLLDRLNKRKYSLDIKKASKIKKQFNQLYCEINIEPKIEKIHIEEVYDIEKVFHNESKANVLEFCCTNNEKLNAENKAILIDIKGSNLDNENLNQDQKDLIPILADLHSSYGDLISHNKDLDSNNQRITEQTSKKNTLTDKKGPVKSKNINENATCNICGKEVLVSSMRKHLKRHKLYGKVLKKGSKIKDKQPLVECDTCGKKMLKKHLLAHFLIHDGGTGHLNCKHCGKSFDRPFGLLRHCRAKHGYEKVNKCSYCDFMGCTEYEVRVHEKLHTGDRFACDVCGKTFIWKNAWSQHIAEHGDPKILCSECPEIFRSTRQLVRHISQKHKRPSNTIQNFQCPCCSHTALHKSTITLHMKRKHGAINKQDIVKINKNQSPERMHTNAKNKNDCLNSQKKLNTDMNIKSKILKDDSLNDNVNFLSAFHKHLDADNESRQINKWDLDKSNAKVEILSNAIPNSVDKALNLQLMDLNADFNSVSEVLSSHHKGDLTRGNTKLKVERDLDTNNDLHQSNEDLNTDKDLSPDNQKVNAGEKGLETRFQPQPRKRPYAECEVCGTMVQEHNLKEHLDIHQGTGKKIHCEHCDKTFSRRSRLLRHCKASHGYEKTDKCSHCEYRGCSRAEVTQHERKHTRENPFACSICGASFRFPSSRQKHMAERHGKGKMVQCEVCAATFLTGRLLSSHKHERHSPHTHSYRCALCHKMYARRAAARRHLINHHQQPYSIDNIIKVKLNDDHRA